MDETNAGYEYKDRVRFPIVKTHGRHVEHLTILSDTNIDVMIAATAIFNRYSLY